MNRYIDAEGLIEAIKAPSFYDTNQPDFISLVNDQPTADVAPVVRGEWIVDECDTTDAVPSWSWVDFHCSVCGANHVLEDGQYDWCREVEIPYNYCPNCGAKMGQREEST